MTYNTTILELSDASSTVEILVTKLEQDYDKELVVLSLPSKSKGAGNTITYIIDLQKYREVITITGGYLLEETASSALTKKNAIETLLKRPGTMNAKWTIGTTDVIKTVNILKCKITELPMRVGSEHPFTQPNTFMIDIQMAVGTHKG